MEPLSSTSGYLDRDHVDQLQDERAELSVGTGEPITIAQLFHSKTSPAAALDDAALRSAGERQALSCPRPSDGDLLRHERADGAPNSKQPRRTHARAA